MIKRGELKNTSSKAFTLIELLGIIVLLAVVVIIATPIVLNIIKEAQESADLSSANLIVSAGKDYYAEAVLDEGKMDKIKNYTDLYSELKIMNKPEFGQLYLSFEGDVAMVTIINNKCYKKTYGTDVEKVSLLDCDLGYMAPDDIIPTVNQEVINASINENGWYNKDLFIKVNVYDNESGPIGYKRCMSTSVCEPDDTIYELDKSIYVNTESANNYVCVIGVDKKGNESEKNCVVYKLDKTRPTINGIENKTINLNEKFDLTDGVSATDSLSQIDGDYIYTPTTIDNSVIGTTTVTYKAKDKAGNEISVTREIEVLGDAPSIVFSSTGTFNKNGWANKDFYVQANVKDNSTKGIKSIKWCSTTGSSCTPSATVSTVSVLISTESANNKVCVEAIDNNNKITTQCSNNYKLDKTKPNIEGIKDITIQRNDKINLSSGVIYSDALSMIDGNLSITPSTIDTSVTGVKEVTYQVSDKAGNVREVVRRVTIDAEAPTIVFTPVDSSAINSNGWANKDFYVRATITDNSGSGIKSASSCTTNSSSECDPIASFTGNTKDFYITVEGSNRACIEVTDNNNKTNKICSDTYKLDKTKPIAGTANFTGTQGSNNWYTSNVTVNVINGTDSLSGHASTTSNVSSITNNTTGTTVTITTTDLAGNSATRDYVIRIDKAKPNVPTVVMRYANNNTIYTSNTWTNQNINVYVSSTGTTSGIAYYEYSTNGTSWNVMSGSPLKVSSEGITNLYFRSVSNSGARSNSTSLNIIKIDKTAPNIVSVTMKKGSSTGTNYTQNTWSNQNIYTSISYNQTDASGIDHYEYSNNGTTWYTFDNPDTITTEGTTNLYFRAVDKAGNNGKSTSAYTIKIDKTAPSEPTITMKKGNSSGVNYVSNTWINDKIYITFSYSKTDTSGIDHYEYSTNNSTWHEVTGTSMTYTTEGTTNLYFRAVDKADNNGKSISAYTIKIDKTAPAVPTIKMTKNTQNGATYTSNTWSNQKVYVTLSVSKTDASGIDHYEYSTNQNTWSKMTNPLSINIDGTVKYYFRSVDGAGNPSSATSQQTIKVDTIKPSAPTVTIRKGSSSGSIYTAGTWQPLNLYITGSYKGTDTSGIAGYQMSTDNLKWTTVSNNYSIINEPGQYTVYLRAVDNAGNVGLTATVRNVYKAEYLVDYGSNYGHYVYYQNSYWRIVKRTGSGSTGTVTLISDGCVGSNYTLSPGNVGMISIINNGIKSYARTFHNSNYTSSANPILTSEVYQYSRGNTVSCSYWAFNSTSAAANYVAPNSTNYSAYTSTAVNNLKTSLSGKTRIVLNMKSGIYITNNKSGTSVSQALTIGY